MVARLRLRIGGKKHYQKYLFYASNWLWRFVSIEVEPSKEFVTFLNARQDLPCNHHDNVSHSQPLHTTANIGKFPMLEDRHFDGMHLKDALPVRLWKKESPLALGTCRCWQLCAMVGNVENCHGGCMGDLVAG